MSKETEKVNVAVALGLGGARIKSGDVGIEVEVEGVGLPFNVPGYRCEHDGSIADGGIEYVFETPVPLKDVRAKLGKLTTAFKAKGSVVNSSMRAGVHCHVNVQSMKPVELFNYITMYLVLEELLLKFCGPTRQGNLFCLRVKDAEYLLFALRNSAKTFSFRNLNDDDLRYGSLNVKALSSYGSLEFRAMESTNDMSKIVDWASVLVQLRDNAKVFRNPADVIAIYSDMCLKDFLVTSLGPWANKFMEYEGWEGMVKDGMRRTQMLAYATDWGTYAEVMEESHKPREYDDDDEDWEPDDEDWDE